MVAAREGVFTLFFRRNSLYRDGVEVDDEASFDRSMTLPPSSDRRVPSDVPFPSCSFPRDLFFSLSLSLDRNSETMSLFDSRKHYTLCRSLDMHQKSVRSASDGAVDRARFGDWTNASSAARSDMRHPCNADHLILRRPNRTRQTLAQDNDMSAQQTGRRGHKQI